MFSPENEPGDALRTLADWLETVEASRLRDSLLTSHYLLIPLSAS